MVWFALSFVFATLGLFAFMVFGKATIHFSTPLGQGCVSHNSPKQDAFHPVSLDRYERILERFLQGDLFDTLWIAHNPKEGYGGVTLTLEQGELKMLRSFLYVKEPDRLDSFAEALRPLCVDPTISPPWNIGLSENFESVFLEYRLELDLSAIREIVRQALDNLDGPRGPEIHVQAWRSQDIPTGFSIHFGSEENVLDGIL